jgi:type II secretory pathway pseudopilin PulG
MSRRSGITLLETLIAIFVTALGLLGLLALFPLGALDMARAIQNSRAAQAAANATAIANFQNLRQDPTLTSPINYFTNPPGWPALASTSNPSYPIYVDTTGAVLPGGGSLGLGRIPTPSTINHGIPRVEASFATSTADVIRWLTLQDDILFQPTGYAVPPNAVPPAFPNLNQPVERDSRYSWAYLLQRPTASNSQVVNLTVVVYSGRSSAVIGEHVYFVDLNANTTSVVIPWDAATGQEKPAVKPGSWILDATVVTPGTAGGTPHGYFYRVVNVSDAGTYTNQADGKTYPAVLAELQSPIKVGTAVPPTAYQQGVIVVMDNVVEVFNRGP